MSKSNKNTDYLKNMLSVMLFAVLKIFETFNIA